MAAVSTSFFVGCESEDDFNAPNYVTFASSNMEFTVDQNSSGSFDVTVYTAEESGSSKTFAINVDESSSISEEDFNVPETVTVPANSNEGSFTIGITDNTIDNAGETLVLTLENAGGYTGEPLSIDILKLCEFESLASSYTATVTAFDSQAPEFDVVLNEEGELVFSGESLWGPNFVAWATGDDGYAGSYVYSGTITLNSDNSITVSSEEAMMLGGQGRYNPCTGTFSYTLETSLFGEPNVMVDVVLTPNEE